MNNNSSWCFVVGTLPRRDQVPMRRKLKCLSCGAITWYDPKQGFRRHRRGVIKNPGGRKKWKPGTT